MRTGTERAPGVHKCAPWHVRPKRDPMTVATTAAPQPTVAAFSG